MRVACPSHLMFSPYHNSNISGYLNLQSSSIYNSGNPLLCPRTFPFSKKPMFFPLVVPRLSRLVTRFPPQRSDLAPRTNSVRFVFNEMALEQVTDRYFCIMPRHSSITRATQMGPLHAADPQRYSLTPIHGNTNQ